MSKFLEEVREQPKALRLLISNYSGKDVSKIETATNLILKQKTLLFTGMGTSYFAPIFIRDKISTKISMLNIDAGELFHYNLSLVKKDESIVIISQSGKSIEVRNVVNSIKDKTKIICITNDISSPLAVNSHVILPIYSGKEMSISSKTYINTLAILYLLANNILDNELKKVFEDLRSISDLMEDYISDDSNIEMIKECSEFLKPFETAHFIGRGPNLVSAYQSSLIFMEGAKCYANAFSGGEFKHGPIELSKTHHRTVIFAPEGRTYQLNVSLAEELVSYGSKVLLLTNSQYENNHRDLRVIRLKAKHEEGFAFLAAVVFEVLLFFTARLQGYTAGEFDLTQKVVERE